MQPRTVQANYDRLAGSYDFWNRWISDPLIGIEELRGRTVAGLRLEPGSAALDVGCGTGLNLLHLRQAVGPEGRVVGFDLSEGMLAQARAKVQEQGWDNVALVPGDAATLAGVDGPFDGVMSTWALGIVHDLPAALQAMVDQLRPGGRLAILDFQDTRPERGLQRLLSPLFLWILKASGIDTAEDIDRERLQARWRQGRALLRELLVDVEEEEYYDGVGFLLTGRKP